MTRLEGRTIVGVFAHPDDESLACGGLLAWCASLGARVVVVSATRGEAAPSASSPAALGDLRTAELHAAGRLLGVSDVVVLEYEDGMVPWVEAERLDADIRDVLARVRAEVVVTFDADGLYWHPDHIAVHERATEAVRSLGEAAPALYYVTLPPGQMRAVWEHTGGDRPIVAGLSNPDAFGALAAPPTLVVDVGEHAVAKAAALRAHRSQVAGTALDAVTPADAPRLLGREHYRRATVGATGPCWLDAFGAPDSAPAA